MKKIIKLLIVSIIFALTHTNINCMYKLPFKCIYYPLFYSLKCATYPLFYTCGLLKSRNLKCKRIRSKTEDEETGDIEVALSKFKSNVKLEDFIGSKPEEVFTLIQQLKYPKNFTKLGGTIPSAVLFYGPNGTGKSTLIKGTAHESNSLIINISHYELHTEENIFSAAAMIYKNTGKRIIILIQKIDEIEKESIWLELEHEINEPKKGVHIFITAKNPNFPSLKNLKKIKIDLPKEKDREKIFKQYFNYYKIDENVKKEGLHEILAKKTNGFSGALIRDIMEKAAEEAGKKKANKIYKKDILSAFEKTKKNVKTDADDIRNLMFI